MLLYENLYSQPLLMTSFLTWVTQSWMKLNAWQSFFFFFPLLVTLSLLESAFVMLKFIFSSVKIKNESTKIIQRTGSGLLTLSLTDILAPAKSHPCIANISSLSYSSLVKSIFPIEHNVCRENIKKHENQDTELFQANLPGHPFLS